MFPLLKFYFLINKTPDSNTYIHRNLIYQSSSKQLPILSSSSIPCSVLRSQKDKHLLTRKISTLIDEHCFFSCFAKSNCLSCLDLSVYRKREQQLSICCCRMRPEPTWSTEIPHTLAQSWIICGMENSSWIKIWQRKVKACAAILLRWFASVWHDTNLSLKLLYLFTTHHQNNE